MAILLYRYVSAAEKQFIEETGMIRSSSGITYFTPDRYEDPVEARSMLALAATPEWRIGGIPDVQMPDFDALPMRVVSPGAGQPGGGTQCATSRPVYLFGITKLTGGSSGLE